MSNTSDQSTVTPKAKLSGPAMVAALLALVLWALFVVWMLIEADSSNDLTWTRLAFLLASVEAVAFAAGGALWGSSIQRERAERAEASAASNQQDAANGRALAATLIADGGAPNEPQTSGYGDQALGGSDAGNTGRRHAELARSLFPDV